VLLGIVLLRERPVAAEFTGMAAIVVAVFLITTAEMNAKAKGRPGHPPQQLSLEL
jgi:drug/metabolite transporter (DMT)-like permease